LAVRPIKKNRWITPLANTTSGARLIKTQANIARRQKKKSVALAVNLSKKIAKSRRALTPQAAPAKKPAGGHRGGYYTFIGKKKR
jgi:hypothetical protein